MGLALALKAAVSQFGSPPNGYCLMPSWTFTASAGAADLIGLTPYFLDVDPASWALDPAAVAQTLGIVNGPVSAVMAVSPFGAALNAQAWRQFEEDTGIPVVLDAAAGFDTVVVDNPVSVVSMHATKVFGIGEGAVILSHDTDRVSAIRGMSNFGFAGTRESETPGINGKITEYTAAIGMAALDAWPQTRQGFDRVIKDYARGLENVPGLAAAPGFADGTVRATCDVQFEQATAADIMTSLRGSGVQARQWWGQGCHTMPAYKNCPRQALPVTENLGRNTAGLPLFRDMTAMQIDAVIRCLKALLER